MVPNICHFIAGMSPNEEFKFVHYMAVVSAIKVNNPDKIHYFYSLEPHGEWWEELKKIERVEFHEVPLPTHFGEKEIIHPQHRADQLRMKILREYGGVYLDFDTICVKPWERFLKYEYSMGVESPRALCNAVIFSKPNAEFLDLWEKPYNDTFKPNGWGEACVELPLKVAKENPSKIRLLKPEFFYRPMWYEVDKIFVDECSEVPKELVTLHYWNKFSRKYTDNITSLDWAEKNSHTMYGKILMDYVNP